MSRAWSQDADFAPFHTQARTSDMMWTITLAAGNHFSDGSPVTASEVASALQRTNQLNNAAQSSLGTMSCFAQARPEGMPGQPAAARL